MISGIHLATALSVMLHMEQEGNGMDTTDSRYPYTYSADWIRMCGIADSRAEAAGWASAYCEANGLNTEDFKKSAADEYISYWNEIEAAEKRMEARKAVWKAKLEEDSNVGKL